MSHPKEIVVTAERKDAEEGRPLSSVGCFISRALHRLNYDDVSVCVGSPSVRIGDDYYDLPKRAVKYAKRYDTLERHGLAGGGEVTVLPTDWPKKITFTLTRIEASDKEVG